MSQEGLETFTVNLEVAASSPDLAAGVFLRRSLIVTIIDASGEPHQRVLDHSKGSRPHQRVLDHSEGF